MELIGLSTDIFPTQTIKTKFPSYFSIIKYVLCMNINEAKRDTILKNYQIYVARIDDARPNLKCLITAS